MRCCSLIEVQAEPILVESCNNDHTRQPYQTFLKVLEKRKKVSMELDQEGMVCVAGTIVSLSEYAMKKKPVVLMVLLAITCFLPHFV